MNGKALSKKQHATQNKLIIAGRSLTEQDGYHNLTMNGVAQRANVSRITAYNYFSNKDHLLAAIIEQQLTEFEQIYCSQKPSHVNASSFIAQSLCQFISFFYASPNILKALVISASSPEKHTVNLSSYIRDKIPLISEVYLNTLAPANRETLCVHLGFQVHSIIINLANNEISFTEAMQYTQDATELIWNSLVERGETSTDAEMHLA